MEVSLDRRLERRHRRRRRAGQVDHLLLIARTSGTVGSHHHREETMSSTRADGRSPDEARPLSFERDFTVMAAGSVLVSFGRTVVLCTASVEEDVPRWLRGTGKGWVTAEYSMLPGSTPERASREAARGKQSGRTQEIQRLIGRSLRTVTDLEMLARRADHRRLRRTPGRRRDAHRVDLRRLRGAARRDHAPGPQGHAARARVE